MLTRKLRPSKFSELVGNELNIELLKAIASRPEETPSTLIFEGDFGCLVEKTKILTSYGLKSLRDILELASKVNDIRVISEGGKSGLVKAVWNVGVRDTIRLETSQGRSLEGTPDHKIRVLVDGSVEWKELGSVGEGDLIPLEIHTEYEKDMLLSGRDLPEYRGLAISDKVISVESSEGYVMDLTVEGNHTYIVDDIITHNSGKCVTSDTRVLTDKGYMKIKDITGDKFEGFEEYAEDMKVMTSKGWRKPSHIYRESEALVRRLETIDGYSIEGTMEHKITVLTEELNIIYKKLGDLHTGHTVLTHNPLDIKDNLVLIPEAWNAWEKGISDIEDIANKPYIWRKMYVLGAVYRNLDVSTNIIRNTPRQISKLKTMMESVAITPEVYNSQMVLRTGQTMQIRYEIERIIGEPFNMKVYNPNILLTSSQLSYLNEELEHLGLSPLGSNYIDLIRLVRELSRVLGENKHPLVQKLSDLVRYRQTVIKDMRVGKSAVYDLTIPEVHDFYANGIINHNTTSARLLAKAINCRDFKGDLCGECEVCKSDLESVPFYTEYDVTAIGQVEKIRDLRDTFYYRVPNHYRILNFDEVHTASNAAQSALLKVFEETPEGVKIIMCTTHPEKLLPTIRSRSLELNFSTQSTQDVKENIQMCADRLKISISDDIAELIAIRSKGHMRDAHMLLDQYSIVGEKSFREAVRSSKQDILRLLVALRLGNKEGYFKCVDRILSYPLVEVHDDILRVLLELMEVQLEMREDESLEKVAKLYGNNLIKIIQLMNQEWMVEAFKNDVTLQTALLALYQLLQPKREQDKVEVKDRNVKR